MKTLVGESTNRPSGEREAHWIDPDVMRRLTRLLHDPKMRGVGYSEFINRACDALQDELYPEKEA